MTTPNHFDRGKPFYPLVMNYIVSLHGYIELSSREMLERLRKFRSLSIEEVQKILGDRLKKKEVLERLLHGEPTPLLGTLSLRSKFQGNSITPPIDLIAKDLVSHFGYIMEFAATQSAGSLLIVAWESTQSYHDHGPLWEFLRHCRHAAAHGGLFTFLGKEPVRLASWGPFTITRSLQGTPLFKLPDNNGMFLPGDPVRLLWDIEQAYPAMRA